MSIEQCEVMNHFNDFIGHVGPGSTPESRNEYAQYCRGIVAASMIGQLISLQRGRELNALIQQTRDQK